MRSLGAACVAAILVAAVGPGWMAGAPQPDAGTAAVIARYQARIPELMAEQGIPGLAIAVVDGDAVLWSQGFGVTERDGGTPVSTDTMFSVQSMSKLFTATAVMQAVGEGRLDLDVPITTYLPEFTVHSAFEAQPERRITLRMLLSHTAGFTHEAPFGNNYDLGEDDFDAHVRSIQDTWLRFPVGSGYAYSNLGIDLAGAILERVRGEPFAAVMRGSLLGPLGMDHSTFDADVIRGTADRAVGHAGPIRAPTYTPMAAAGGLYASAADLAAFLRFQLGGGIVDGHTVLDPALMEEMRTVPAPHAGAAAGYALGVQRTHWRAGRYLDLFSHGGGGFGVLADLWWLPQLQLGIAVLTNSSDHTLQGDLALSVLRDLVTEPGSVYRDRIEAILPGTNVYEGDGRFQPPGDLGRLIGAAAMPATGDEADRWAGYEGAYRTVTWGVISPTGPPDRFVIVSGTPTYETAETGTLERHALVEVARGVFLADDGETVDFSGPRPTRAGIDLVAVTGGPAPGSWLLLGIAAATAVTWLVGGLAAAVRRRRGPRDGRVGSSTPPSARRWRQVSTVVATIAALLVLCTVALLFAVPSLVDSGFLGWLELSTGMRLALHLPLAVALAAGILVGLGTIALARGWSSPAGDPRLAGLTAATAALALQLAAWHLVGWGFA